MHLKINTEQLKGLMKTKGWNTVELAKSLDMNYSYVYRVLKGERNAGGKFFSGLLALCKKENISFEQFVYVCVNKKNNGKQG